MEFKHKSVLLEETIDNLNIKPDGIYVDGTLGGAGHSYQIAKRLTSGGRLIGIDQDADAIAAATERLKEFEERVTIVRNNYCNMDKVLDELGDPRLIARTLLDTDVDNGQLDYEEYSTYSDDAQNTQSSSRNHVHVWRFDTWYSKLLGVVILLIVVFLLFHILVAVIPFFAVLALILFIVSLIKNRN